MDFSEKKDPKSILPMDDNFTPPRVLILCPDKTLAPMAAAEPWYIFKEAGCVIEFATENGDVPKADQRMLERSAFRDIMGATLDDIEKFYMMAGSDEYLNPRAWSNASFSLLPYDAIYITTGFDARMRQFVESESLHKLLASYFPLTKRRRMVQRAPTLSDKLKRRSAVIQDDGCMPKTIIEKHEDELGHLEGPRRVVGAMGKGVLALSMSMVVDNLTPEERKSAEEECAVRVGAFQEKKKQEAEEAQRIKLHRRSSSLARMAKALPLQRSATTGSLFKSRREKDEGSKGCPTPPTLRSVIHDVETTTTPAWMENLGTTVSAVTGFKNMFKTYTKSTQEQVVSALKNPTLYHAGPPNKKPFTHSASTHHYVSARYPLESTLAALHVLEEIAIARVEWGKSRV
ncbi:hypothetical protein AOL_s00083g361 [Orbilia oligospora ATCC 24927]|uniref:Uncharacterized protein n=1 Tax=Arthrobotrys oligospora (strain ATCC 24927 / CBS 115.81 / DSM 1491) TaxID=756982 RepID=G1XH80_ARTOA|nr:hypothetical protein AOL_s00083g361 [Orbilia oligospora ATCC 24927]EGX47425.1 hypothetical protein AOL_s00083g361 [Orbilia oligospora ATCC 24927]